MNSSILFKNLNGKWNLKRSITKTDGSSIASYDGMAFFQFFEKKNNHLFYREEGHLRQSSGHTTKAYKEYHFIKNSNSEIDVYFDKECRRHFHKFIWQSFEKAIGKHLCAADLYSLEYAFAFPNQMLWKCSASGPKKDYVILSTFEKILK